MPDPHDTLSIFAEVAIALAGFSGIALAFGRRSSAEPLTGLEIRRLTNLFVLSGMVLFLSLTGMSLLHIEMDQPSSLWVYGSGFAFVFAGVWMVRDLVSIYRLSPAEKAKVSMPLVAGFDTAYLAVMLLQIANCVAIKEPWPFLFVLVVLVAAAFQQFILLVWTGIGSSSD